MKEIEKKILQRIKDIKTERIDLTEDEELKRLSRHINKVRDLEETMFLEELLTLLNK